MDETDPGLALLATLEARLIKRRRQASEPRQAPGLFGRLFGSASEGSTAHTREIRSLEREIEGLLSPPPAEPDVLSALDAIEAALGNPASPASTDAAVDALWVPARALFRIALETGDEELGLRVSGLRRRSWIVEPASFPALQRDLLALVQTTRRCLEGASPRGSLPDETRPTMFPPPWRNPAARPGGRGRQRPVMDSAGPGASAGAAGPAR